MIGLDQLETQRRELDGAPGSGQLLGESIQGFDPVGYRCGRIPDNSWPAESTANSRETENAGPSDVTAGAVAVEVAAGMRRRGRPRRSQARMMLPPAPPSRRSREGETEEDVCFICFDGGNLVLCDRRGCPKAYHPACIKRDESFFKSKAKWNCGWHICNSCKRASYYFCYTCQYSLCKMCVRGTDYAAVRGSYGFCEVCMRTILLIENVVQEDKEKIQVDFDDVNSWEYLFKVYWVHLKGKLSLSVDELVRAKNPWKGTQRSHSISGFEHHSCRKLNCSEHPLSDQIRSHAKRKKSNMGSFYVDKLDVPVANMFPGNVMHNSQKWATEELLEFVEHLKDGDRSALSHYDIQNLLLDYVKRNNLYDPSHQGQVKCDSRLLSLFRKEWVDQFEMLKLLESHFLLRENSAAVGSDGRGPIAASSFQRDADRNPDSQVIESGERCRIRERVCDEELFGSDEYATIDIHNICLIYLTRNLMEDLIDDVDKYHEKVIGLIVRLRISSKDQWPETYRLVQVVGTCKGEKPYSIGRKTTDVMLEVLNLDKEAVSVDEISNQEFTEDECQQLRKRMECGLVKWLKVCDVREKAMMLQAAKIDIELRTEISLLNRLCLQAREKGQENDLRKLVEKLEVLKSPEERNKRLQAIPIIHSGSSIAPSCGSEYVVKTNPDDIQRTESAGFCGGEAEPPKKDLRNPIVDSTMFDQNKGVIERFLSFDLRSEKLAELPIRKIEESRDDSESRRIWHYQDPSGKIQGPFPMMHLRKWSTNGQFPPDLRVWRVSENKDDAILLIDALRQQHTTSLNVEHNSCDRRLSEEASQLDERLKISLNSPGNDVSAFSSDNSTITGNSVVSSKRGNASSHAFPAELTQSGSGAKVNSLTAGQPLVNCTLSLQVCDVSPCQTTFYEARDSPGSGVWSTDQSNVLGNPVKNLNEGNSSGNLAEDCGQNWKALHENIGASIDLDPGLFTVGNSLSMDQEIDFLDLPYPEASLIPDRSNSDWQAIIPDPDECEESVSDLLAELEAKESLKVLSSSPTSNKRLCPGAENNCSGPVMGTERSRDDAVSSTNDLPLPFWSLAST